MTTKTSGNGQADETIEIPALAERTIQIHIKGSEPLLCDRLDPGPLKEDPDSKKREKALTPEHRFRRALYDMRKALPDDHPEKYGFPARAFRKAMISAARMVDNLDMVRARMLLSVPGDLLPLKWKGLHMRIDTPRNPKAGAVLAYRAQFDKWSVVVPVSFSSDRISLTDVLTLNARAGSSVGVGSQRHELGGSFGYWKIVGVDG